MLRAFCRWLLYKRLGWTKEVTVDHPDKFIICFAPHTSNWDFALGQLYNLAEGMSSNYLMKKEWFFWPLGPIFKHTGGIPVYKDRHRSLTDILADEAIKADKFHLTITPEGTRKMNPDWKKGFYYIALKANIPILLYRVDFKNKTIQCTKSVKPTGDIEKELPEIKEYFRGANGKKSNRFAIE